jgi:hypothetical protein
LSQEYKEVSEVKSILLLATALFLISAPTPDSKDIAEMTSNFIVPQDVPGLQAAEEASDENKTADKTAVQKTANIDSNSKATEAEFAEYEI